MNYEQYLVAKRDGTSPPNLLAQAARLKTIEHEIDTNVRLDTWLTQHAGSIMVITDAKDAAATVDGLKALGGVTGIDIETAKDPAHVDHQLAGLHPKISKIRLVQLFHSIEGGVVIIDCFSAGYDWLAALYGGHYVAHNALFECAHFWHHIKTELHIECTMLAGRVFYGENRKLSDLVAEHLDLNMSKALQTSDWSRPALLNQQYLYAAADAVAAKLLWHMFGTLFNESADKYRDAYNLLTALVYPVVRQAGMKFDLSAHADVVAKWQHEEQSSRAALASLGLENPGSVKQKQRWLHSVLSIEDIMDWPPTDNGNLSTAADVLERALHIPGAAPLARWSQVTSRLSNFGPDLAALTIEGDLYPNYKIAGSVTGRFGCSKPNIQNQPRTGFKHLYQVPAGYQFVTGDLSQIELRVAGLVSGDPAINEAYANGQDLHREVAAERAGKDPMDVTKGERQAAKAINFGLIFGAGANTLRQQAISSYGIEMTIEEAREAKEFFHAKYQRLTEWQQQAVAEANAYGFSESPYVKLTRRYEERVYTHAMNFPIQSGAWEVLALAIVYIDSRLPSDGSIRISHHVYDELCLLARDDQVMTAALLLRDGFLHGFTTVFPDGSTRGLVEIGTGRTWEDAGKSDNKIQEASL